MHRERHDARAAPSQAGRKLGALHVVVLGLTVVIGACDEDSTSPPPVLEGRVVDAAGTPVAGARIGLVYDFSLTSSLGAVSSQSGSSPLERTASPDTVPIPPLETRLGPTYPNPFQRSMSVELVVAQAAQVLLGIHDVRGEPVRTLVERDVPAGVHRIDWDARDEDGSRVPNGIYTARFSIMRAEEHLPIGEAQLFRNDVDIADFAQAYHAVTNADGRFSIALATLPIGQDVTFVDITGGDQGVHTVLATVLVCAVREEGDTLLKDCADAELGDLTRSVTVDLQLGQP
ncbi:MAG: hypothetical protein JSW67_06115 [Candidatus Latescibacterota bacterium]|nr:MAG: hypothetical protein JSW67_06115 [Candidatus Latescibacterota bacterium]